VTRSTAQDAGAEAAGAFDEGRAAFEALDLPGAHAAFERAHRRAPRDPRFMSWYGLTLVLVERNSNLGIALCGEALRAAGPDPELFLNQARAHVALNQRERAVGALLRGLESWPDHPGLTAARDALGTRRTPVIPFLSRDNPLNRLLGRLRHRWSRRSAPSFVLSPAALGLPPPPAGEEPRS